MPADELSTEALLMLLGALTDRDRVPVGLRDPQVRLQARAMDLGIYSADPEECSSRRVDLRGPEDEDPGPLPMDEAPEDEHAIWLRLD